MGQEGAGACALAGWLWWAPTRGLGGSAAPQGQRLSCCPPRPNEPGDDPFQLVAQGSLACCRERVCLHLIFKCFPGVVLLFKYIYTHKFEYEWYIHIHTHTVLYTHISSNLKFRKTVITASQAEYYQPT